MRGLRAGVVWIAVFFRAVVVRAASRFPQPDFERDYQAPSPSFPAVRPEWLEWLDVGVLAAALGLAVWLSLFRRSRRGLVLLGVVCLAYFGFWKGGCVCAVGSVQNVGEALFRPGVAVPLSVVFVFVLPLATALFAGRAFCGAVCPLGVIQDVVAVRPVRVPTWLGAALGVIPVVYLGFATASAASGLGYPICRFDPFVAFFRFSGPVGAVTAGVVLLAVGVWVARPYCRFLCPYGVLLGWMSRLAARRVTITPDRCIQCRLCENACPFDAIEVPTPVKYGEPVSRAVRRFALLLALWPLLVLVGWGMGRWVGPSLAQTHREARLLRQLTVEDAGDGEARTVESAAFRESGGRRDALASRVAVLEARAGVAYAWGGALVGLIVGARLLRLSVRRRRADYEPDAGRCLSCGRCFAACPRDESRRAKAPSESGSEPSGADTETR